MTPRWLLLRDRPELDLTAWLLPEEAAQGQRYRHPGRRRQYALGRAAARLLLHELLPERSPLELRVLRGPSGAPEPRDSEGRMLPVALSLSHSGNLALAAALPGRSGGLGVDLERVEPRHPAFLEDHFTEREQVWFRALPETRRWLAVSLCWAAKEAVLKAVGVGLGEDARRVELSPCPLETRGPTGIAVSLGGGPTFEAGWESTPEDGFVMVWAAAGAT